MYQAPAWMKLRKANATTTTHSQVWLRKTVQPSRSSVSMLASSARSRTRGGTLTFVRRAAARSQASASTASAQPAPKVTTMSAARVGPTTAMPPRDIDRSTFACWSRSRGTSCGTTPAIAGKLIAETIPLRTSRTMTIHSSATPLITRYATVPCVAAERTADTRMISARSQRSATTPPKSRKTTIGMVCAARTRPSALAESLMSSTAKASATETMSEATMEARRAA